jgi:hypothetical protein
VNASKLLEQLDLNKTWYIPGIELGTEVWNSSGTIQINQFNINLNGHNINEIS